MFVLQHTHVHICRAAGTSRRNEGPGSHVDVGPDVLAAGTAAALPSRCLPAVGAAAGCRPRLPSRHPAIARVGAGGGFAPRTASRFAAAAAAARTAPSPGAQPRLPPQSATVGARAGGPQPRGARARATPAGPAELAHPRSEQAKESGGPSAKRPGAPRIPCQSSPVEQCLPARRCPRLAVGPVKRTVKPARAYTA